MNAINLSKKMKNPNSELNNILCDAMDIIIFVRLVYWSQDFRACNVSIVFLGLKCTENFTINL